MFLLKPALKILINIDFFLFQSTHDFCLYSASVSVLTFHRIFLFCIKSHIFRKEILNVVYCTIKGFQKIYHAKAHWKICGQHLINDSQMTVLKKWKSRPDKQ